MSVTTEYDAKIPDWQIYGPGPSAVHALVHMAEGKTKLQSAAANAAAKAKFEKAVADSKTLSERPDNQTLLKLYALYKQASAGDVEGKRPGFTDMVGRAKYDAWAGQQGKGAETAMQEYIDLIESLK